MKNIRKKSQVANNILTSRSKSAIQDSFILKHLKGVMLLFIIIFGSTSLLNAQQECTDGVHDYKVIDSQMSVTTAISLGLLLPDVQAQTTPQYIILMDNLTVDQDYHFSKGSDIIGNEKGELIVGVIRHLYIDSTKVHGCNELMYGISTKDQSKLTITKSELFNMATSVRFYGENVEMTLIDNVFSNNKVVVETYKNLGAQTIIYGNTFIGGTLTPPYGTDKMMAFDLYGVDHFTIGELGQAVNTFEDYSGAAYDGSNAVISIRTQYFWLSNSSIVEIKNSSFLNSGTKIFIESTDTREDELLINGCNFSHTRLNSSFTSNLEVYDSEFYNPHTTAYTYIRFKDGGSINVRESVFDSNVPIIGTGVDAIWVERSSYVDISENEFENFRFAIHISDCYDLDGVIKDNESIIVDWEGIRFSNNICNSDFEISGNNITSNLLGIGCGLSENVEIKNNEIVVSGNPSIGGEGGIVLDVSNSVSVKSNFVEGSNSNGFFEEGLSQTNSPFCEFSCNRSENFQKSYLAILDNQPSDLIANRLKNYPEGGIVIGYGNLSGHIGRQDRNGNAFLDIMPPYYELYDPEESTEFIISNLTPNISTASPTEEMIPNPYVGYVEIVGGPGSLRERWNDYCLGPLEPIDRYGVDESDFNGYWRGAMVDSLPNSVYGGNSDDCEGALFSVQYDIFTALFHNPNLLNEVEEAQKFWDDKVNSPLGKLFFVANAISNMTTNDQADSIVYVLNGLSTTEIFETNLKDVFKYRLITFTESRDWTASEIANLESIASQCYLSGGRAVSIARVLLGANRGDYNDRDLCDGKIEPRNETKNSNEKVSISPNPNTGVFELNLSKEYAKGSVEVFNSLGQRVYYSDLVKNQNNKKISLDLLSGTYFVKVILDDKTIATEKIEILK